MKSPDHVTLRPRYLRGKESEWIDRCDLMTHYMFECLCNYVENELRDSNLSEHEMELNPIRETLRLYEWWTQDYPQLLKEDWYYEYPDSTAIATWKDMDECEHLYDLLALRLTMWT